MGSETRHWTLAKIGDEPWTVVHTAEGLRAVLQGGRAVDVVETLALNRAEAVRDECLDVLTRLLELPLSEGIEQWEIEDARKSAEGWPPDAARGLLERQRGGSTPT